MNNNGFTEQFFTCDRGTDGILLTSVKEHKEIHFALFGYAVPYNTKPSLIERVRYAIYHIRTGKKHTDSIIMNHNKAKELAKWINSNV